MRCRRGLVFLALATPGALTATGCKRREVPPGMVGSYTRSGELPGRLRAELSLARGGIVLTVVRPSASVDLGGFASLFSDKEKATVNAGGKAGVSADYGRSVVSARTFQKVACDGTSCRFDLAPEDGLEACSGSFETVQKTLLVVASGACQPYSGRWTVLETGSVTPEAPGSLDPASSLSPPSPSAPSFADGGVASAGTVAFPPDIPAPHDHMSCLAACTIVHTRCHRESDPVDRAAFMACVEKKQICDARCEQAFPFFGRATPP